MYQLTFCLRKAMSSTKICQGLLVLFTFLFSLGFLAFPLMTDKTLSWKHHIDHITIKVSRTVGLIAKLRHFLPTHTLLSIYQALIAPYLTYRLTVWGQACKYLALTNSQSCRNKLFALSIFLIIMRM